jgi:hypothetical protein
MAYLTQQIVEADLGADVVATLTRGSPTRLARFIASATARVQSALHIGGYAAAVPASVYASTAADCPVEIVELTLRVFKRIAYERGADLSIPPDQVRALDMELLDVETGRFRVEGVTRSVSRSPGGITATDGDPESTASSAQRYRPQVFARSRMTGF